MRFYFIALHENLITIQMEYTCMHMYRIVLYILGTKRKRAGMAANGETHATAHGHQNIRPAIYL